MMWDMVVLACIHKLLEDRDENEHVQGSAYESFHVQNIELKNCNFHFNSKF